AASAQPAPARAWVARRSSRSSSASIFGLELGNTSCHTISHPLPFYHWTYQLAAARVGSRSKRSRAQIGLYIVTHGQARFSQHSAAARGGAYKGVPRSHPRGLLGNDQEAPDEHEEVRTYQLALPSLRRASAGTSYDPPTTADAPASPTTSPYISI